MLFVLGSLVMEPQLIPDRNLQVWIEATFGTDPLVGEVLRELLSESWQLYEQYTAPLGVGFMVRPGHHYGPDVDGYEYTPWRSEEHTSELQSRGHLVCRLLLEKKKRKL